VPSKMKQRCWSEGIGIGFALGEAVAATSLSDIVFMSGKGLHARVRRRRIPLARLAFPAKPVERSDWSGGLRGGIQRSERPIDPGDLRY
jgi:hypothetical protein